MPPARGRFSDEGEDVSRILALSDGVFAFAMTLLVINLIVPTSSSLDVLAPNVGRNAQLAQYLGSEWPSFFAYALAFIIIGTWWMSHLRLFRLIRRYDRRLMTINLLFLMLIAVTPFVVGILASFGDTTTGVTTYAATQALAGLVLVLLWVYVGRWAPGLADPRVSAKQLRQETVRTAVAPVLFGASIPVAFLSPSAAFVLWIGVFVARAFFSRIPMVPPSPPRS